jgi:hypothetical protein
MEALRLRRRVLRPFLDEQDQVFRDEDKPGRVASEAGGLSEA